MADELIAPQVPVPITEERRAPTFSVGRTSLGLLALWGVLLSAMALVSCGGPSVPGTSPDYDSPKEAGKSYVEFVEKRRTAQLEMEKDNRDSDLSYYKDYEDLYEDKEEWKKQYTQKENWIKVFKENKSKLLEFKPEDEAEEAEKAGDRETGRKIYKCTVKRQDMAKSGDDNWKLEERALKYALTLAKIDGKWLIVNARVE